MNFVWYHPSLLSIRKVQSLPIIMVKAAKKSRATAKRFFLHTENELHQALDVEAPEETILSRFDDYKRRWEITHTDA